jgi:hypothetical protein
MRRKNDWIDDFGCGGVILILLGLLFLAFAIMCFEGWILMLLWNWLLVSLFGISTIGFWQSVGLIFLLNFIGGFFNLAIGKN